MTALRSPRPRAVVNAVVARLATTNSKGRTIVRDPRKATKVLALLLIICREMRDRCIIRIVLVVLYYRIYVVCCLLSAVYRPSMQPTKQTGRTVELCCVSPMCSIRTGWLFVGETLVKLIFASRRTMLIPHGTPGTCSIFYILSIY